MDPLILLVASFAVHTQHVRRRMELYMAFVRKMEPNMYFINAYWKVENWQSHEIENC